MWKQWIHVERQGLCNPSRQYSDADGHESGQKDSRYFPGQSVDWSCASDDISSSGSVSDIYDPADQNTRGLRLLQSLTGAREGYPALKYRAKLTPPLRGKEATHSFTRS